MTIYDVVQKFFRHWENYLFTEPLVMLSFVVCAVDGWRYPCKNKLQLWLLVYFIVGAVLFFVTCPLDTLAIFSYSSRLAVIEAANTFFVLTEFVVFYHLFKHYFLNKRARIMAQVFLVVLISLINALVIEETFANFKLHRLLKESTTVNAIESVFLSVMCLAYFSEFIKRNLTKRIAGEQPFPIITVIFFYAALTIPFFIVLYDLAEIQRMLYHILAIGHYLLLTALLFTIRKTLFPRNFVTLRSIRAAPV